MIGSFTSFRQQIGESLRIFLQVIRDIAERVCRMHRTSLRQ
jgi:hypothetical protein